jgi:hypothetical protein
LLKPIALLPAALVLAIACVSPAIAAPASKAALVAVADAAGKATKADDASTPEARLKARIEHVKSLWSKVKGLRAKSKTLTKAEIAKLRSDLEEARAETKAGKNMLLTGMINKAEKDLDKMKPVDGDASNK